MSKQTDIKTIKGFFLFPAFVMTCKPPLYMGPEYIKYFSDKTMDVSQSQNITIKTPSTVCSGR